LSEGINGKNLGFGKFSNDLVTGFNAKSLTLLF